MKTTNPSSRITISQNGNQILTCKVYKEPNYILSMSNEEILELISGLDYMGNIPTVPDLEKPIEIQVSTTRQIPLEQNKEVQTKIKEIIYNNLYDTCLLYTSKDYPRISKDNGQATGSQIIGRSL